MFFHADIYNLQYQFQLTLDYHFNSNVSVILAAGYSPITSTLPIMTAVVIYNTDDLSKPTRTIMWRFAKIFETIAR